MLTNSLSAVFFTFCILVPELSISLALLFLVTLWFHAKRVRVRYYKNDELGEELTVSELAKLRYEA